MCVQKSQIEGESLPLGEQATVFQDEVVDILQVSTRKGVKLATKIFIYLNSQVILKAILKPRASIALIQEGINALEELARTIVVKLKWVRAHNGVKGNELADEFALPAAT